MTPKQKAAETKEIAEGRIVHFVDTGGKNRAAIITHVWNAEGTVNLFVFPDASYVPLGLTPTSVPFDTTAMPYSWHWIEKV